MQSRNLINTALLFVVAGLAITAWLVYQDKTGINYLSSQDVSAVTRIVIPREHSEIVLHKQDDSWHMEKPYALPAHAFRVNSLLDLLKTPVSQSYAASELDLTQFGLNPPHARIRFNDTEIHFGTSSPVNNKRYILSNNRVYLLDDRLYPLISAEAASLVNLALLPATASIEKIILPDTRLQKNTDNIWHDAQGKTIAADNIQQLLDNWRDASAFAVHAYMVRAGAKTVTLELANQTILQFLVSATSDWLIIGRPDAGVEYHLDTQYREKLLQLPDTVTGNP